jgi:hypothetical protein
LNDVGLTLANSAESTSSITPDNVCAEPAEEPAAALFPPVMLPLFADSDALVAFDEADTAGTELLPFKSGTSAAFVDDRSAGAGLDDFVSDFAAVVDCDGLELPAADADACRLCLRAPPRGKSSKEFAPGIYVNEATSLVHMRV